MSATSAEHGDAVIQDPAKVGGVLLFAGTRVPVAALFENLRDGATVDEFLAWFPGVAREHVEAVLEQEAASFKACRAS